MSAEQDLFTRTFDLMNSGDCLILGGGTFPGEGEEAVVTIDLQGIIPIVDVVRSASGRPVEPESAPYDNPLEPAEPKVELTLLRREGRFKFDYGDEWFRIGKRLGVVADHEVDIVLVGGLSPDFYFIAKP